MIRILLALSKISGIANAFIKKNVSVFNSNNTELLNVEQVKEKLLTLEYIRDELASMKGTD